MQLEEHCNSGPPADNSDNTDPVAWPQVDAVRPLTSSRNSAPRGDIREAQLADTITGPVLQAKELNPHERPNGETLLGAGQKLRNYSHNGTSLQS